MSIPITVYIDAFAGSTQDPTPVLYVERDECGELLVVPAHGKVTTCFRLPDAAVELTHPDDAVWTVIERIADVPMPRAVRAAIAERLGADEEDIGTAPPPRKRKVS